VAARALLRRIAFIDFFDPDAGVIALVLQLSPEHRPARIEHGLGHVCFCKASSIHIANEDRTMFFDKPGTEHVQEVLHAV
jgi:hypothetical protein